MFRLLKCSLLLFIVAAPSLLFAQSLPLPDDSSIQRDTLPNGISYYICPLNEGSGRIALRLVVPVGSVREEEHESGIAHLVEHLLFHGTESFSKADLQEFLQDVGARLGADYNAFTGFEDTIYHLDIPADEEHLERAIALMSEWASTARLDEEALREERAIVIEEWRSGLGAGALMLKDAVALLAENSPYADRLPIGKEEIIRTVPIETIRAFYDRWYKRLPVAIVVVGDVDGDMTRQVITRYFGALNQRMHRDEFPRCAVPRQGKMRIKVTRHPEFFGVNIAFLFKGQGITQANREELRDHLVTQAALSLLNNALREATDGHAEAFSFPLLPSMEALIINLSCAETSMDEMLDVCVETIATAHSYGFPEEAFARAVQEQMSFIRLDLEGLGRPARGWIADRCAQNFLHGAALWDARTRAQMISELLQEITREEVHARVAQLDMRGDCVIHITASPHADIDEQEVLWTVARGLSQRVTPFRSERAPSVLMERIPAPGKIASRAHIETLGLTELSLSNGMRVLLLPTQEDHGRLLLSGTAPQGLASLKCKNFVDSSLAAPLLADSGIGGHAPEELAQTLAGKQVSVGRQMTHYTRNITGYAYEGDAELLFQLLHLIFTGQVNDQSAYERLLDDWRGAADGHRQDPHTQFSDAVHQSRMGDHPYFRQPTEEDFDSANFETADALALAAFGNPAEFTLIFSGNFSEERMEALVRRYLASIPQTGPPRHRALPLRVQFPEGITEVSVYAGSEPQSIVQISLPLTIAHPTPERLLVVDAACRIIRHRIFQLLRERLTATYSVTCEPSFLLPDTSHGGFIGIQFVCDPQDALLLSRLTMRELRLLRDHGPLTKEIESEVRDVARQLQDHRATARFWAQELTRFTEFGWSYEGLLRLGDWPQALTKSAIREQLEEMLSLGTYAAVILFPEPD